MIYGKTYKQSHDVRSIKNEKKAKWHRMFAWIPVTLDEGGREVWLQFIETRTIWIKSFQFAGKTYGLRWSTEYRLITKEGKQND